MVNITIKGIPERLYEQLKQEAGRHRRSVNQEIIYKLEQELMPVETDESSVLKRAGELRKRVKKKDLNMGDLEKYISEGRI